MLSDATPTPTAPLPLMPLLLDAQACADLCRVSRATWFAWQAGGLIPLPIIRRGRIVRWRRLEIESWILAGAPSRDRWDVLRGARP